MRENFEKAITVLFDLEGYVSDDKADKGGYTKYGIAQQYHPNVNVPLLTKDQAIQIYLDEYWIPAGCDTLDYPLDMCLFIQYVNLPKAKSYLSHSNGLLDFFMYNLQHYVDRPKDQRDRFLTGWCNRLIQLWKAI
jgi:hypothetical protein